MCKETDFHLEEIITVDAVFASRDFQALGAAANSNHNAGRGDRADDTLPVYGLDGVVVDQAAKLVQILDLIATNERHEHECTKKVPLPGAKQRCI